MDIKKILIVFSVGITVMATIVFYIIISSNEERDRNLEIYKDFNFKGTIIKKTYFEANDCLVKVLLTHSNIKKHDIRERNKQAYLCVIQDSLAEVLIRCGDTEVGDTLSYSDNVLSIYNENNIKQMYVPSIVWGLRSAWIQREHDL